MRLSRRSRHAAVLGLTLALTLGCSVSGESETDPWGSAGVDHPEITEKTSGGRTVVTVSAETTLPLEDEDNQTGFARRVAKLAWRTHLGRVDALQVTAGQAGHPDRRHRRGWSRAGLEEAFGPRLAGLDAGDESALRQTIPAKDGPYSGREAERVTDGAAIMREIVRTTGRETFGTAPGLEADEPEECLGGLGGNEPTGEFESNAEAEIPLPKGTHPVQHIVKVAEDWSRMGLEVEMESLFTGTEDGVGGTLSGVGRVSLREHPVHSRGEPGHDTLILFFATDCLKP